MKYRVGFWLLAFSLLCSVYVVGWQLDEKDKLAKSYEAKIREMGLRIVSLNDTMDSMEIRREQVLNPIYGWPVHEEDFTYLTSGFGLRDIPAGIYTGGSTTREHAGTDFAGVYQARLLAVSDGVVVERYLIPGVHFGIYFKGHPVLGGMIKIRHDDGTYGVYGHMSAQYVMEGEHVTKGQEIGRMGDTGLSDGPHLHFELHDSDGNNLQPLLYLSDPREIL